MNNESAYISTEKLAELIATLPANKLRILNASVNMIGNSLDVYREHATARISGARFLDLGISRDITSPYPFMMPDKE